MLVMKKSWCHQWIANHDRQDAYYLLHELRQETLPATQTDIVSRLVMLRFPNFDFRSISIRFLAQNDDFDSIQF